MIFFSLSMTLFAVISLAADRLIEGGIEPDSSRDEIGIVDSLKVIVLKKNPHLILKCPCPPESEEEKKAQAFFIGLKLGEMSELLNTYTEIGYSKKVKPMEFLRVRVRPQKLWEALSKFLKLDVSSEIPVNLGEVIHMLFHTELLLNELLNLKPELDLYGNVLSKR